MMLDPMTVTTPIMPWRLEQRQASGLFLVSHSGALLCRLDIETKTLYFYDRKSRREVGVRLEDLTIHIFSV
jgi:hypothetical protein